MIQRLVLFTLFVVNLLTATHTHAQDQTEIDSLEHELSISRKQDTTTVNIYNQLGFLYRQVNKPLALSYLDSAVTISKKINYKYGLCNAYNRIGIIYRYASQLEKSIEYYQLSIELAEELNDKKLVANVINNLGNIYKMQGEPIKAAEAFVRALKMREEINDKGGEAAAYSNLANLYLEQLNFSMAIENAQKCVQIYTQIKDSFEMARAYSRLGFINYYKNSFDTAIHYCLIGLDILNKLGDKHETAMLLTNIGNIYAESGQPKKAIPYHKQSLTIQQTENDSIGIYTSYLSLAQTYSFLKQNKLAEQNLEKALNYLENINGIINMSIDGYLVASQIYRAKKDYQKAYNYFELHTKLKDSLLNETNNKAIAELQEKYESDKKDILIEKSNIELTNSKVQLRQRNIIAAVLAVLVLLISITSYLLYNRYKLKKQQELSKEILKQQKIRSKAVIDAEERERVRIAQDLHDGLGQQLSAVKLMANALDQTNDNTDKTEKLSVLKNILDDTIKELRTISHNMMPNVLFKLGLSNAIRDFVDKVSKTGTLKVDLQIVGLENSLDKTTEIILYRVIQELVNNIIKHAQANTLSIQIVNHDSDGLNIVVEDDGIGFDVKDIENFKGIGLKNMKSRIEYIGGTIDFDSTPNRGTTVIIDIPS